MNKNHLIIHFTSLCGGLGDRIVGLTSAILIAKYLKRKLFIKWDHPNVSDFIQIKNQWKIPIPKNTITLNTLDNRFKYKYQFTNYKYDQFWKDRHIRLLCNQNIAEFIYRNHHIETGNFEKELINAYRSVFKEYLIPLINNPTELKLKENNYIGLQIRTGDKYMGVGKHQPIKNVELLINIISIFIKMTSTLNTYNTIYVTSDHKDVCNLLKEKFPGKKIINSEESRLHFEKSKTGGSSLVALIHDLITLSKSKHLIISHYSNYGRMAVIINETEGLHFEFTETNFTPRILKLNTLFTKHDHEPKITTIKKIKPKIRHRYNINNINNLSKISRSKRKILKLKLKNRIKKENI